MISYNQRDFESMRQDAIKRIREMHSYAQTNEKEAQNSTSTQPNSPRNNNNDTTQKNNSAKTQNSSQQTNTSSQNQNPNKNANQQNPNNNNRHQSGNYHRTRASNPFAQLFGSNLGGFNRAKQNSSPPPAQKPPSPPPPQEAPDIASDIKGKIDGFLKDFNIDEEKIILALLIYSLYKNNADYKLLLALAYLII